MYGETPDLLARFQEAARRGDWATAGKLAVELKRQPLPEGRDELGEYLQRLQHALAIARASRAAAAGTLSRISAVAGFNGGRAGLSRNRQNFVDLTNY